MSYNRYKHYVRIANDIIAELGTYYVPVMPYATKALVLALKTDHKRKGNCLGTFGKAKDGTCPAIELLIDDGVIAAYSLWSRSQLVTAWPMLSVVIDTLRITL